MPCIDGAVCVGDNDDSSDRLESSHTTPQRGRLDQRSTSGASDAKYLKGAGITRDEVSKFVAFLERYDANGEYVQGGVTKFIDTDYHHEATQDPGRSGAAADVQLDTS